MSFADTIALPEDPSWRWRLLAGCLILATACLRILYLAYACPLDLAPDEAHYWDWSRHLDWSYYSKGPLVAYLIRVSTALTGSWSRQFPSGEMLAVRLPAVLCGSLLLVSLYVVTVQVYRRERLAAAVVALALTFPLLAAGSSLMTIDAPYICCWGWALVLGHRAVLGQSAWAWPAAGIVIGLGIMAKYTMVLWVPSLGLFLLTSAEQRRLLLRPGFWTMTTVAAISCLPILFWNARHDWVSLRHVEGQAGLHTAASELSWLGPWTYLGTQFGLLLGFWFVAWLAALLSHRPWREQNQGLNYLWWMSVPMFAVFLGFSFKNGGGKPNWPVTAYLSGLVLTVGWLSQQLRASSRWKRRLTIHGLGVACLLGLTLTVVVHRSDWLQSLLLPLAGPATEERPVPLRRLDPTCRLRGWRLLAEEVDRLRAELVQEGIEPVLAGAGWTVPGELAFYCQGHPMVYSLGLALGDRYSQYDLWRPNPIKDPDAFLGRTVIVVGEAGPSLREAFDRLETARVITISRQGQPLARWTITLGKGFSGFPKLPEARRF